MSASHYGTIYLAAGKLAKITKIGIVKEIRLEVKIKWLLKQNLILKQMLATL